MTPPRSRSRHRRAARAPFASKRCAALQHQTALPLPHQRVTTRPETTGQGSERPKSACRSRRSKALWQPPCFWRQPFCRLTHGPRHRPRPPPCAAPATTAPPPPRPCAARPGACFWTKASSSRRKASTSASRSKPNTAANGPGNSPSPAPNPAAPPIRSTGMFMGRRRGSEPFAPIVRRPVSQAGRWPEEGVRQCSPYRSRHGGRDGAMERHRPKIYDCRFPELAPCRSITLRAAPALCRGLSGICGLYVGGSDTEALDATHHALKLLKRRMALERLSEKYATAKTKTRRFSPAGSSITCRQRRFSAGCRRSAGCAGRRLPELRLRWRRRCGSSGQGRRPSPAPRQRLQLPAARSRSPRRSR